MCVIDVFVLGFSVFVNNYCIFVVKCGRFCSKVGLFLLFSFLSSSVCLVRKQRKIKLEGKFRVKRIYLQEL
jgi:hypothetical protein